MTADYPATAAKALALCAAHDPWFPEPNRATAAAWADQIANYQLGVDDVLAGVRIAYRDNGSGFRPLPRDIVQAALAIRRDRLQRESREEREAREDRQDAALEARRQAAIAAGVTQIGRSVD